MGSALRARQAGTKQLDLRVPVDELRDTAEAAFGNVIAAPHGFGKEEQCLLNRGRQAPSFLPPLVDGEVAGSPHQAEISLVAPEQIIPKPNIMRTHTRIMKSILGLLVSSTFVFSVHQVRGTEFRPPAVP